MTNRIALASCLAAAACLITVAPAAAARIYNFLPIQVRVSGLDGTLSLQPGQVSPSISWSRSTSVKVSFGDLKDTTYMHGLNNLCQLNFGLHAEVTGGHYLIIGHSGMRVVCSLCDSDYHLMHQDSRNAPESYRPELQNRSSKTGC